MRIIPVIDLAAGLVVHGIAGDRARYRPIVSQLADSAKPIAIARSLAALGCDQLYLADLDAIAGAEPAWAVYEQLLGAGHALWIDAGLADARRAAALAEFAICHPRLTGIVSGLESLAGPAALAAVFGQIDPQRLIFSLDLRHGRPLTAHNAWREATAEALAAVACRAGARRAIVLDLAHVGAGQGIGTHDLCRRLRARIPQLELISGGGVRDADDLTALSAAGCSAALVASALHDGRLTAADCRRWNEPA